MMCSEDDLKELSIPMGPRKKILSYQKDYAKEKVCCYVADNFDRLTSIQNGFVGSKILCGL